MVDGEPRMSRSEVIEEVEFLLAQDVSPLLIPSLLHRTPSALEKLLRVAERGDLALLFQPAVKKSRLSAASKARKAERQRERIAGRAA